MFRPLKDGDKLNAAQKELLNLLRRKSFEDSKSHADKVWPIFHSTTYFCRLCQHSVYSDLTSHNQLLLKSDQALSIDCARIREQQS